MKASQTTRDRRRQGRRIRKMRRLHPDLASTPYFFAFTFDWSALGKTIREVAQMSHNAFTRALATSQRQLIHKGRKP